LLASYNFKKPEGKGAFDVVALGDPLPTIDVHNRVQHGVDAGALVADAINWAKRLIDTPAAALTPKEMAKQIATRLENDPAVSVEIWNESKIKDERLGGLLAVGQGSDEPVRVAYATYQPAGSETWPHIALVGKGITFDSGGLSLKTYEGMLTMKTDMSGAAIVMAALSLAARMKLSVRLTAIALMSENLTGGSAQKPGDVFTARNGMTVEVLNTDAEGRLVLADGLSLAAEVKPDAIVDVATLTGAARIALGDEMAAYMASTDEVARSFESAAARAGEDVWRLPLYDKYASHLDSEVADMKNIGKAGNAGTIVAGLFLQKFVGNTPWVHLDMAAPGRADAAKGYWTKGATAFGARAIVEFLRGVAAE
jgi:leucyl aminopeptidase